MNVLTYDPFVTAEQAAEGGAEKVELEQLMCRSDFVSIHVPLNESTRYNAERKRCFA